MNRRRLLLGGMVAGFIYNVSGMTLAGMVLSTDLLVAFDRMEAPTAGIGTALLHVVTRFAIGLLSVWLYAMARTRLSPGPSTAAIVGGAIWFLLYVPYMEAMHLLGVFPPGTLGIVAMWGFLEVELATLFGAWFYRESINQAGAPA